MGKNLSRATLKAISDAWNSGQLLNQPTPPRSGPPKYVRIRNTTGAVLHSGAVVCLDGFSTFLSFKRAAKRALNNTIVLDARTATKNDPTETLAVVRFPIYSGRVGYAEAEVRFAPVSLESAEHKYCNQLMTSTAGQSAFRILARSENEGAVAFCALAKVSAAVGQSLWTQDPDGDGDELNNVWGNHIEVGKGLALYDAGECGHGAEDGHIIGIKAVRVDNEAALQYGEFITSLGVPSVATIKAIEPTNTVEAVANIGECSTATCLTGENFEKTTALSSATLEDVDVVTAIAAPMSETIQVIDAPPQVVTALKSIGEPIKRAALAADNVESKRVVTAIGTASKVKVLSSVSTAAASVVTGLGTVQKATVTTLSGSPTTATALSSLGTPQTGNFLTGRVGEPVPVVTGFQFLLDGVPASSVQVLTGVECRDGGVYGLYSTLTISPVTTEITPINDAATGEAVVSLGEPTPVNVLGGEFTTSNQEVIVGIGEPVMTTINTVAEEQEQIDVLSAIGEATIEEITVPKVGGTVQAITGFDTPETVEACGVLSLKGTKVINNQGETTTRTIKTISGGLQTVDVVSSVGAVDTVEVVRSLGTIEKIEVVSGAADGGVVQVVTGYNNPTKGNAVTGYRE